MDLKEWWDVEVVEKKLNDKLFYKQVEIIIKNHSPYPKKFKVYLKKINIKDHMSNLRVRMYINIAAPVELEVDKYSKASVTVNVPSIYNKNKEDHLIISVQNLGSGEEKDLQIFF